MNRTHRMLICVCAVSALLMVFWQPRSAVTSIGSAVTKISSTLQGVVPLPVMEVQRVVLPVMEVQRVVLPVIGEKLDITSNPQSGGPGVCENILTDTMNGRWQPRDQVTEKEKMAVKQFYVAAREEHEIPVTLQRKDLKCGGNVSYPRAPIYFRAMCDPDGPTPCCYNGTCVNRTLAECTCSECLDVRQSVQAELSAWKLQNPECAFPPMSPQEACHVLRNTTLLFIGDSLMRHVYTAFVMQVNGDFDAGALNKDTPEDLRKTCSGMYVFTEKVCRLWLERTPVLCNGTVHAGFVAQTDSGYANQLHALLSRLLTQKRVFVLLNVGVHTNFDFLDVQKKVLLPWLVNRTSKIEQTPKTQTDLWCGRNDIRFNMDPVSPGAPSARQSGGRPWTEWFDTGKSGKTGNSSVRNTGQSQTSGVRSDKTEQFVRENPFNTSSKTELLRPEDVCFRHLVWMTPHIPGVIKNGRGVQGRDNVVKFNKEMRTFLRKWNIPILDTSRLTDHVLSQDGTHYGLAVNYVIAQTILRYIESLHIMTL